MLNTSTCPPLTAEMNILPFSVVTMAQVNFRVMPGVFENTDPSFQDVPIIGVTDGSVAMNETQFHAVTGGLVTLQTGLNVLVRAGTDGAAYSFWNAGKLLRLGSNGTVIPFYEASQNQWQLAQFIALERFAPGEVFWARRLTGHPCLSGI